MMNRRELKVVMQMHDVHVKKMRHVMHGRAKPWVGGDLEDLVFDQIVADLYQAAVGEQPWGIGLERLRTAMSAQVVNLYGAIKASRAIAFSFEVGQAKPEAALDFIRKYHMIDPRAAMAMGLPVGQVMSCHHAFDETFVAKDPFYQEFLIPYGGRYSTGLKLYEDERLAVIVGIHRPLGMSPMTAMDESVIGRLGVHLQHAMAIYLKQQKNLQPASVGMELLNRLPHPMLLVDETRRIVFANEAGARHLSTGGVLNDRHGLICGPKASDDAQLLIALRSLMLSDQSYLGQGKPTDRIFLRLQNARGELAGIYLYALRSASAMGAFGPRNLALMMIHDPRMQTTVLDPFVVAATWDLTPAEARVAIAVGQGRSSTEISLSHGVSVNTVRTQVQSAMEKWA